MFKTVSTTLASSVATSGTFTVPYPDGTDAGAFVGGTDNKMTAMQSVFEQPAGFTLSFGTSNITVTYKGATTIPAGELVRLQLDMAGGDEETQLLAEDSATGATTQLPDSVSLANLVRVELGAPDAADADGVCASQAGTASTAMTINGALASGGVATFDKPRNVVAAWTNTATLTVTGTDEYGKTVVETSGSGTSMAGKKAFKTITSVVPSANITGATVGSGDVLGLPVYFDGAGVLVAEMEDGAAATAGTLVGGLDPNTASTATTGDTRGTYDPNSACDGAKAFTLLAALVDPVFLGNAQYGG